MAKEKSIHEETQELLMGEFIESILPKVQPFIKPALKKLTDYMNSGKTIIIQPVENKVYVFVMDDNNIEKMEFKNGSKPDHTYGIEDFLQKILSGEFKGE